MRWEVLRDSKLTSNHQTKDYLWGRAIYVAWRQNDFDELDQTVFMRALTNIQAPYIEPDHPNLTTMADFSVLRMHIKISTQSRASLLRHSISISLEITGT